MVMIWRPGPVRRPYYSEACEITRHCVLVLVSENATIHLEEGEGEMIFFLTKERKGKDQEEGKYSVNEQKKVVSVL